MKFGIRQVRTIRNRPGRIGRTLETPFARTTTRDCLDPWTYLEVTASGGLKPCCNIPAQLQMDGSPESALDAMSSPQFRELRRRLLAGDLNPHCEKCHVRKRVPRSVLRKRVAALQESGRLSDPLEAAVPTRLRIDVNELCNLRCDYCAVTHPDYVGQEMPRELFPAVIELTRRMPKDSEVDVNGHGETTYHPRWMEVSGQVLDAGHRPHIITNLAKTFSDEEIDLLARFAFIKVSLDSDDDKMMRAIRKAVRVDHVFATIDRIRASAARQGVSPPPEIYFSVGVYDPSVWVMERFVAKLIGIGVVGVVFWNLVEYSHQTKVRALRLLDDEETARTREILSRVKAMLETAGTDYEFLGDFNDPAGRPLI